MSSTRWRRDSYSQDDTQGAAVGDGDADDDIVVDGLNIVVLAAAAFHRLIQYAILNPYRLVLLSHRLQLLLLRRHSPSWAAQPADDYR